jgi:general stress protein YciG
MKPTLNSQPAAASVPTPFKTRPAARIGDGSRTSMDPAEQRRIASEGGKASHASGQGHKWTAEEAREAGRKGGLTSRRGPSRATDAAPKSKAAK